ncbi:protein kinase [Sorangium sp. So ce295]|uniref:serine/threonine protein kinase n=1 Tax=Sorangium sp. So ce295 TaxID=3133295 RepID=UPI003F5ED869
MLAEGIVFARRYRVVRLIATGAMGAIHEVTHIATERRRALKVMHAHLFQSEEMRERFKLEACITATIECEHIVDVFDAGVDEATGMPFLVMELLRGEELGERLKRTSRLPPADVVTYLHQAALALDRTHAANVVHRDLKPANLFLSQREDGSIRVKVLDFGVAKLVAEGATAAGATRSLGTPLYMAPEQFQVGKRLTSAADIHALGMMAYTLLVGFPYWDPEANEASDVFAFAMLAVRGPQEPPVQRARSLGVTLPPGFDAWFARATALEPAARFRRATDAVSALGEVFGVPLCGARVAAGASSPPSSRAGQGSPPSPEAPSAIPGTGAAPGMTEAPEHGADPDRGRFAATSTGAAVTSLPPKARRKPLAAGIALGVGTLAGAALWLSQPASNADGPAAAGIAAAISTASEPSTAAAAPLATAHEARAAIPEPSSPPPTLAPAPPPAVTPSADAPGEAAPVSSASAPASPGKPPTNASKSVPGSRESGPRPSTPEDLFSRY